MTKDKFLNTHWGAGMKVLCKPMELKYKAYTQPVVCVNFDQCLIATCDEDTDDASEWNWWRCENCEIVNEQ